MDSTWNGNIRIIFTSEENEEDLRNREAFIFKYDGGLNKSLVWHLGLKYLDIYYLKICIFHRKGNYFIMLWSLTALMLFSLFSQTYSNLFGLTSDRLGRALTLCWAGSWPRRVSRANLSPGTSRGSSRSLPPHWPEKHIRDVHHCIYWILEIPSRWSISTLRYLS